MNRLKTFAIVGGVLFFIYWTGNSSFYPDSLDKMRVNSGLTLAQTPKNMITGFYSEYKRLPQAADLHKFHVDGTPFVRSVNYDVDNKMLVVTFGAQNGSWHLDGKRLAMHADLKEGAIKWTCRNIDVDDKFVPSSCR